MALIGEEGLDLAILPIGDYYTMGPDDAIRAVKLLKPRYRPADPLQHVPAHHPGRRRLGRAGQERDRAPSPSSCSRGNGSRSSAAEGRGAGHRLG